MNLNMGEMNYAYHNKSKIVRYANAVKAAKMKVNCIIIMVIQKQQHTSNSHK